MTTGGGKLIAITPAHDEAAHLRRVVDSMVASQRQPDLWVIVDDASTDHTGAIADEAAEANDFIRVLHRQRPEGRRLSSKAEAVMAGYELAASLVPDAKYVASIDGDVELPPDAFTKVVEAFQRDPRLGITGGVYQHPIDGKMVVNRTSPVHVPGPYQVFRREVFDAVGGYLPLPRGGLDVVSTAKARMLGWETRALSDLVINHNRRVGTGGDLHPLKAEYRNGIRDYSMASDPLFEVAKCASRLGDRPRIIGAIVRLAGYVGSAIRREPRGVPDDVGAFIRAEHRQRMLHRLGLGRS